MIVTQMTVAMNVSIADYNPKIIFLFDKEKDAFNNWDTANNKTLFGDFSSQVPSDLFKICKDRDFLECRKEILDFLGEIHESPQIDIIKNSFQQVWSSVEKQFFTKLKDITKKPFKTSEVKIYLTTLMKCPYNARENWVMSSLFHALPRVPLNIAHELLHIHFHHNYWERVENEIGMIKTHDLKESLTVLLNLEFSELFLLKDNGYEKHKELRKFIEKEWKELKDFDGLINKCVTHLKI